MKVLLKKLGGVLMNELFAYVIIVSVLISAFFYIVITGLFANLNTVMLP